MQDRIRLPAASARCSSAHALLIASIIASAAIAGCASVDPAGAPREIAVREALQPPEAQVRAAGRDDRQAQAGQGGTLPPGTRPEPPKTAPGAIATPSDAPVRIVLEELRGVDQPSEPPTSVSPAALPPAHDHALDQPRTTAPLHATTSDGSAPVRPAATAAAPQDLWARMRAGFRLPPLDTPLVAEKERAYLARPDDLLRMLARGAPYLHFIVEEIDRRGLPMELALLPFVESAMNPKALSSARASGLWQFIPATGRRFSLVQDWWGDERRDVVRSTRAALDYLSVIHRQHGDWFLTLASYNWGENAVARAVQRNRARGLPGDYLSLRMPRETRHYVPKLMALRNVVARADALRLALPRLPDEPYFASVTKTRPIDLALAAEFAGLSVAEFVALNPSHHRPVIAASGHDRIRLPADRVDRFLAAIERHQRSGRPLATWQPYTLKRGETLQSVSRRVGVPAGELRRANGLGPTVRVVAGSRLLVPQRTVKNEMLLRTFAGPRVFEQVRVPAVHHVVRRGETQASVAKRYGVSVAKLRRLNGKRMRVRPGSRLLVRPASVRVVLSASPSRPLATQ